MKFFETFPLVPEEMSFKGFSISSFGGHFVQQNYLSNDGRWSPKEHFCEIIMISGHWPTRYCLKVFSIFSSGGHFVQPSEGF